MLAEVLHNLALRMIQESLESMNEKIKKNWKKVTALGGGIPCNKAVGYITWNSDV